MRTSKQKNIASHQAQQHLGNARQKIVVWSVAGYPCAFSGVVALRAAMTGQAQRNDFEIIAPHPAAGAVMRVGRGGRTAGNAGQHLDPCHVVKARRAIWLAGLLPERTAMRKIRHCKTRLMCYKKVAPAPCSRPGADRTELLGTVSWFDRWIGNIF